MACLNIPFKLILQFILMSPVIVYGCLKAAVILLFVPKKFLVKKNLTGQTVLITGAGSGLGRELAIQFSKLSTRLVLLDLYKDSLLDTQKLLEPNTSSFVYECDVSDRHKVYEVADLIKRDVGKVDVLVNNAGVVSGKRFLDIPDEKIQLTMDVNATAHFWTCKAFLPAMIQTNKGHIVAIASLAGKAPVVNLTDYCASKYAAVGFMESLGQELISQKFTGVKVTTICPTLMTTGLFEGMKPPLLVSYTPEYVAARTIQAIVEEKEVLLLPEFMVIPLILHLILPVWVVRVLSRRTGLLYIMDEFKGRDQPVQQC